MKLLYGTGNRAKLAVMRKQLAGLEIELVGLDEMGLEAPEVVEDGETPLENARKKALAYYEAFHTPVFSCDSGLYFDHVPDEQQPGVHVRRVGGRSLTDEEMTAYYSGLAKQYGGLVARYKNAICLVMDEAHVYESMDATLESEPFLIVDTPHPSGIHRQGFPLDCLSVELKTHRYYYDLPKETYGQVVAESGFGLFFKEVIERLQYAEK